jgi:hypothetical protein
MCEHRSYTNKSDDLTLTHYVVSLKARYSQIEEYDWKA